MKYWNTVEGKWMGLITFFILHHYFVILQYVAARLNCTYIQKWCDVNKYGKSPTKTDKKTVFMLLTTITVLFFLLFACSNLFLEKESLRGQSHWSLHIDFQSKEYFLQPSHNGSLFVILNTPFPRRLKCTKNSSYFITNHLPLHIYDKSLSMW